MHLPRTLLVTRTGVTSPRHDMPYDTFFKRAADTSPEQFRAVLDQLRRSHPDEIAGLCVRHVAENGLDEIGKRVVGWLCKESLYLPLLLDAKFLRPELAARALEVFRTRDEHFSLKFSKVLTPGTPEFDGGVLPRALELLSGLHDYGVFLPHLQVLTKHSNPYIRSKAVKAFCQLRPTKSVIQRQTESADDRVRANAVEAMWHVPTDDARKLFRTAAKDANHRVVLNALVGQYFLDEPTALNEILKLTDHSSPEFRRAAVWALGFIADPGARNILETLKVDASPLIRLNAQRALAKLPMIEQRSAEVAVAPEAASQLPTPPLAVEEALVPEKDSETPSIPKAAHYSAPVFKML